MASILQFWLFFRTKNKTLNPIPILWNRILSLYYRYFELTWIEVGPVGARERVREPRNKVRQKTISVFHVMASIVKWLMFFWLFSLENSNGLKALKLVWCGGFEWIANRIESNGAGFLFDGKRSIAFVSVPNKICLSKNTLFEIEIGIVIAA